MLRNAASLHINDLTREQQIMDDVLEMAGECPALKNPEDMMTKRLIGGFYMNSLSKTLAALRRSGCHENGELVTTLELFVRLVVMPTVLSFNLIDKLSVGDATETVNWAVRVCGGLLHRYGWDYTYIEPETPSIWRYGLPSTKAEAAFSSMMGGFMATNWIEFKKLKLVLKRND
jgi:hypothetical protein